MKKATIEWEKKRKEAQEEKLKWLGEELDIWEIPEEDGYETLEKKEIIKKPEVERRKILLERKEQWRLKSREIWLSTGNEKSKFFHNYAKGRKNSNTILGMRSEDDQIEKSFAKLASMGKDHFMNIFKAPAEVTIVEVVKVAQYFPRYV